MVIAEEPDEGQHDFEDYGDLDKVVMELELIVVTSILHCPPPASSVGKSRSLGHRFGREKRLAIRPNQKNWFWFWCSKCRNPIQWLSSLCTSVQPSLLSQPKL